jgi:hypothetical protein
LEHLLAYEAFVRDIELYEQLFDQRPAILAHDLHRLCLPQYAQERAARGGWRSWAQHHHRIWPVPVDNACTGRRLA